MCIYLVRNKAADVEGKRENTRKQHHLRCRAHRQFLPTTHDLRHLTGRETHQAYLQECEGTHLRQQIDLMHLQIALQYIDGGDER